MRTTIAIAALTLLAACGETPASTTQQAAAQAPPVDPQMEVTDTDDTSADIKAEVTGPVAVVQTVYDGFAAGDIALATSNFSETIVWNEAESSPYSDQNPYEGPDEIVGGLFARLGGEWDYFNAVPSDFISEGDKVVAIGRYSARHAATGKEMDIPFVHVWTVEDGAITAFQQYTDTKTHTEVMTE